MLPEAERPAVARALAKEPRGPLAELPGLRRGREGRGGGPACHRPPWRLPTPTWRQRTTQPDPLTMPPKPEFVSELVPSPEEPSSRGRWLDVAGATRGSRWGSSCWRASSSGGRGGAGPGTRRPSTAPGTTPRTADALPRRPPRVPNPARSHIEKGLATVGKESSEQAIAEFDEAIRLEPGMGPGLRRAGYRQGPHPDPTTREHGRGQGAAGQGRRRGERSGSTPTSPSATRPGGSCCRSGRRRTTRRP